MPIETNVNIYWYAIIVKQLKTPSVRWKVLIFSWLILYFAVNDDEQANMKNLYEMFEYAWSLPLNDSLFLLGFFSFDTFSFCFSLLTWISKRIILLKSLYELPLWYSISMTIDFKSHKAWIPEDDSNKGMARKRNTRWQCTKMIEEYLKNLFCCIWASLLYSLFQMMMTLLKNLEND